MDTPVRWLQRNTTSFGGQTSDDTHTEQDTYEFIAFVLWYLFLVLCCVVPTCCAYRRRRLVEARLAQQQSRLTQQQFELQNQQQRPNFILFDQMGARRSSERVQSVRTEKLGDELKETTMTLSPTHIEEAGQRDRLEIPELEADLYGEEAGTLIRLPTESMNGNRTVPGICAICLCPYEDGDRVSWSTKCSCQHAFHTECIIPWLAKKEEQKCPVCRQDFCRTIHVEEDVLEDPARAGDLFLDSFALALSYARAQSAMNWGENAPVRSSSMSAGGAASQTGDTSPVDVESAGQTEAAEEPQVETEEESALSAPFETQEANNDVDVEEGRISETNG